jgi:hypothetical protein
MGPPVPIVSDAAIATNMVGDGRFVPLVIMDTTDRPEIAELIYLQENVPPGDVVSGWASLLDGPRDHFALVLQFQRPIEVGFALNFDLGIQGSVIELALRARAIYLQAGKPGDRIRGTFDAPRMIAELGADLPLKQWDELWSKAIKRKLRAEGLRNADAKRAAQQSIKQTRAQFRNSGSIETERS